MKIVFHISVALLTASVFLSLGTSARAQGTITSSSRIPFHSVLEQLDRARRVPTTPVAHFISRCRKSASEPMITASDLQCNLLRLQ